MTRNSNYADSHHEDMLCQPTPCQADEAVPAVAAPSANPEVRSRDADVIGSQASYLPRHGARGERRSSVCRAALHLIPAAQRTALRLGFLVLSIFGCEGVPASAGVLWSHAQGGRTGSWTLERCPPSASWEPRISGVPTAGVGSFVAPSPAYVHPWPATSWPRYSCSVAPQGPPVSRAAVCCEGRSLHHFLKGGEEEEEEGMSKEGHENMQERGEGGAGLEHVHQPLELHCGGINGVETDGQRWRCDIFLGNRLCNNVNTAHAIRGPRRFPCAIGKGTAGNQICRCSGSALGVRLCEGTDNVWDSEQSGRLPGFCLRPTLCEGADLSAGPANSGGVCCNPGYISYRNARHLGRHRQIYRGEGPGEWSGEEEDALGKKGKGKGEEAYSKNDRGVCSTYDYSPLLPVLPLHAPSTFLSHDETPTVPMVMAFPQCTRIARLRALTKPLAQPTSTTRYHHWTDVGAAEGRAHGRASAQPQRRSPCQCLSPVEVAVEHPRPWSKGRRYLGSCRGVERGNGTGGGEMNDVHVPSMRSSRACCGNGWTEVEGDGNVSTVKRGGRGESGDRGIS